MPLKVTLVFVDSGGGHRAAANALCEVIQARRLPWEVRADCIQRLLDSIDVIRKTTGIPFQDIYNILLRKGWTGLSPALIPAMHLAIRCFHHSQVSVLEKHWRETRPDLVVSLIPHFNRALKESIDRACPGTPLVTILTDIADYPPHFWLERQDQWVICGSDRATRQAFETGLPPAKTLRSSGMILHPRFYEPPPADRRAERARLGLDPDLPTGLVLFGGEGSLEMFEIARRLNRPESGVQLILLCGRHDEVRRKLDALPRAIPMFIEGFTNRAPYYMDLADFFVGKPGPGSISEAAVKRLPIIVRRDWRTLAHERYNCDWILEQNIGVVVRKAGDYFDAVREILQPERYRRLRANLGNLRNEAVFEIPAMLEHILAARAAARDADLQIAAR
jgi:1,2-diacylglycerol 3-beta-galactosyltransferase